jgi:hypothetical protein
MRPNRKISVKVYCSISKTYCNVVYEFETITTKLGRKISGPKGYRCENKDKAQASGLTVENTCGCGQQYIKFLKNKNIVSKVVNTSESDEVDSDSDESNVLHNKP